MIIIKTILRFDKGNKLVLPTKFKDGDVRFSDSLAEYFISQFTNIGDTVFDPFAGFGTTLYIADKLNRRGIGIEYLSDRVDYIKSVIKNSNDIICGSALNLSDYYIPMIEFSITSPPYMSRNNHLEYPFSGYEINGKNYDNYLDDIIYIYIYIYICNDQKQTQTEWLSRN